MKINNTGYIYSILLIVGIFFPTSIFGTILKSLLFISSFILFIAYVFFLKKNYNKYLFFIFILINLALIFFTVLASNLYIEISYGIFINFFLLSFLFLLDFNRTANIRILNYALIFVTWALILLGVGVILQITPIVFFLKNFYSASYEDLTSNMIALLKPVGTFATHSVSGFIMFLLFYLNFKSYKVNDKIVYLFNSIALAILLFFIRSNTSILFLGIALAMIGMTFFRKKFTFLVSILLVSIPIIFFLSSKAKINKTVTSFDLSVILDSKNNGISGRYAENSVLRPTIDYIIDHPLSPLGLAYSPDLYFTDSGVILYLLRGSLILVILIYLGLYLFFKVNLNRRKEVLFVFGIFLLFEIGYPILLYLRTQYILPFFIIYLNSLKASDAKS